MFTRIITYPRGQATERWSARRVHSSSDETARHSRTGLNSIDERRRDERRRRFTGDVDVQLIGIVLDALERVLEHFFHLHAKYGLEGSAGTE